MTSVLTKCIQLQIPVDVHLPDCIQSFHPQEIYLMCKLGSEVIQEGRKWLSQLSYEESRLKMEQDFQGTIQQLQQEIQSEQQVSHRIQSQLSESYEKRIQLLNQQLIQLTSENKQSDQERQLVIQEQVNQWKEKYESLYQEKEKQVSRMMDTHEKWLQSISSSANKSNSAKGSEGERLFEEIAKQTFLDFPGYHIVDKHTQGGEGDFHLHFDEFHVLVDAKNYKKKVPVEQREKIKKDLLKNSHVSFAWLVSLNTNIDKYDRSPIMYEWINSHQCIVYVNHLMGFQDPSKILRIVWFACHEMKKMISDEDLEEDQWMQWKEYKITTMNKIRSLRKNVREIVTSMNATRNLVQLLDDELKVLLESETDQLVESNVAIFDSWWQDHLEMDSSSTLISTDLWMKFKTDNKDLLKQMDSITLEKFKNYLKSKLPHTCITMKTKNANSSFELKGIRWKATVVPETSSSISLELQFTEPVMMIKKQKI